MTATNVPKKPPFGFRIHASEQGATIALEGELDLAHQAATSDAVARVLDRRLPCLVLDLSRLSFIDSCGIHVLISAHKRGAEQGTQLVIIPGPPAVQRVLEICGLTEILRFRPQPTAGGP